MRRGWLLFVSLLLIVGPVRATVPKIIPFPTRQQIELMFVSFRDPDLPDVAAVIEETETQILEGRNTPIHFRVEYLDPAFLSPDPAHRKQVIAFFRERYQQRAIDVVIALDEQALHVVQQARAQLFPDTPLLFSVVRRKYEPPEFKRPSGSTGVIRILNYVPSLQMALRQNPGTRHVIVITGSSNIEKFEAQEAHEEFRPYEADIDFQYWTGLTIAELRSRIAGIDPRSVVLFLNFLTDAAGEQFVPSRLMPTLSSGAKRPIYGISSLLVGNGVVGGSVTDHHEVGRLIGQSGLRVLQGEKAENIPLVSGEFQHPVFDWRQLSRWGIPRDQLPPASTILFWESSPWETYRWKILTLSAALGVETLLITLLLQKRSRQRYAEQELRREKEELSEAQRVAKLSSWQWYPKTDEVTWSDTPYCLTGSNATLTPATLQNMSEFLTSESWQRLTQILEQSLRTGTPYELELDARSADGARVSILTRGVAVRDADGHVTHLRGTMQDITERKRSQDALRISEEKFSKAFKRGPVGISITTVQTHRYVDVNETFESITGYSRQELIGRSIFEVELWMDPTERVRLRDKLVADGKLENVQCDFRRKDGQRRTAETSAELIDIGGEPCILKAVIDVTERHQAEQALQESEKRFRLMADSAPVLMWLAGPDKLWTDCNKAWLNFTGRRLQEQLGEGWTLGVHPEDLKDCLDAYTRAFDLRKSFQIEYRLRRHDGEYRWVLDQGTARFHDDGSFAGYVGCCIDISAEKEAKLARMEFSARLLRAQEEERARIARELHDDINQRLALLSNELHMVEATIPEAQAETKDQLRRLFQHTKEITNDIQGLSHELHPSKLQYLGLASATRAFCQDFSAQHDFQVDCIVEDLPPHIDPHIALGLFRVTQEALHNVAKHSHADHVKVELTGGDSLIRLCISDDGTGFDAARCPTNAGLGLVSMQERLRLVGGQLKIWSRPSLGTQVVATVPIEVRKQHKTA